MSDLGDKENAGAAFGLVMGAAAATAIGASAVFFPRLAVLANHRVLAASLGFAAGVMTYVSLVDIYGKAIEGFEDAGHAGNKAFSYATFCFFAGSLTMMMVKFLVEKFLGHYDPMSDYLNATKPSETATRDREEATDSTLKQSDSDVEATDDSADLDILRENSKPLFQMGVATALAVGIHNFPDGLVTFIAYMDEPSVGIALAIGIAVHNIPEGLCVSMPIYYATGHRWKAFLWGILSGMSEPIGALIGWLVLKQAVSGNTFGILFGLVSGMMTFIAIDELLPMAHKYDPDNKVVTYSFLVGMMSIAGSIMLFKLN